MKAVRKIFPGLICGIFLLQVISLGIQIYKDDFKNNNETKSDLLRGNKINPQEEPAQEIKPDDFNFKLQGTSAEAIEDYVDQISNVDSSPDLGSHDIFNDLRATDSIYDSLSESSGLGANLYSWDAPGGFGNYLQVGVSGATDFGSTSGTISMWLKFDVLGGRFWGQHGDFEVRFGGVSNTELYLDWGGTSSLSYIHDFTLNKWYFWVVTWDESSDKLIVYQGDETNQPTEVASNTAWSSQVSTTGVTGNNIMNSKGGDYEVDGHVEDFRYYNIDRSLSAIQNDYKTVLTGSESNLVHYYKFENDLSDSAGTTDLIKQGSGSYSPDTPSGMSGGLGDYQLDLEVQFIDVIDFLGDGELCIKTGSFVGSEVINVTYWDGDSWKLITSDLTSSSWNNYTILQNNFTNNQFTIKFGGSETSSDTTQDSWNIDSVLLRVKDQDEVWGNDYGFIWLDSPNEVDLGTIYGSWVLNQDLSNDGVPNNAIGVILAWVETSTFGGHAVARGSEDRNNDYMNGGSIYCEFEAETWRMQMVKLGVHKYIDTWRDSSSERLYVMGYTIGTDPRFNAEASNLGSLIADSTWHNMTISGLDENTTGVILFGQVSSFTDTTLLVRAVGSTDNMIYREWEEYNCGMLVVKVDNNDKFQYYVTSGSSAKLYLIAEVGESIDWLDTTRDDISATSTGWNTTDLDDYITFPPDASGIILQFETTRTYDTEVDYNNIAREYGQTWTFPTFEVGGDQWLMGGSGIDLEHQLEIYAESTRADVYVHALTKYIDKTPPEINNFGVDDPGNGTGIFWANLTDDGSIVANVTLKVASVEYKMSFNGTYWINASPPILYGNNYNYQIVNASDIFGNKITNPSSTEWHRFDYDTKAPELIPADKYYFFSIDSFKTNFTNTWGVGIDTVIVNGTKVGESNYYSAVMVNYQNFSGNIIEGYINDTLSKDAGWSTLDIINYTIFVNDTAGNYFISDYFQGYIFTNTPPSAVNIVYYPRPLYSNSTLLLSYDWSDPDPGSLEGASEIRWYRKPYGESSFHLEPLHNDSKQILAYYLLKGDEWYATVKPKDGEDFGSLVNESSQIDGTITVMNTPPSIIGFSWQEEDYYTIDNISFTFTFIDDDPIDSEDVNKRIVYWSLNGSYDSRFDNQSFIPYINTTKEQNWSVQIIVFDGTNYSKMYSLLNITILNSPPEAESVAILPSFPYTNQQLNASWTFNDFDNDIEDIESSIIIWYKNGIPQPRYDNKTIVPSNETARGENWQFKCWITDGSNYSSSEFWSLIITIENSKPQVSDITINSGTTTIYTTNNLEVTYLFEDFDEDDVEVAKLIQWYLFDEIQPLFANKSTISSVNTSKGQEWIVSVAVKDNAGTWSDLVNSSKIIISNTLPSVLIQTNNHPDFIIEDQDLDVKEDYYTFNDADIMDLDKSLIKWYRNDIYQTEYDNKIVPASDTNPGEVWYYILTPFDGEDNGTDRISPSITIESRPMINNYDFIPINDTEGHYELEFNITDSRNTIKQVEFYLSLNSTESLSPFIITSPRTGFPNLWVLDYRISNYSYLDTVTLINVIVVTEVIYSSIKYEIELNQAFTFTIRDTAPPRVINAWFEQDKEPNPTNLTFYADIVEHGSGISEIILYYYFVSANNGGGEGSSIIGQNYTKIMDYKSTSANYLLYSTTVEINDYNTNLRLVYWISTKDNNGNINEAAFDNLNLADQNIIYQSPGLPEWLLIVGIAIIVFILVSSIVYVKFIRKPEIRGLDKELVLEGINKITETDIMRSLDAHTIGIVVSFFDQRHGPIPIITIPTILKDNWSKLMELSDRSFSGTQFSDEFNKEVVSNYEFLLDRGIRVNIMSFGFSLERPEARGGQENITENILIHKDVFPLLNHFQEEIQELIHKTHVLMDKEPSERQKIHTSVFNLRKYVTAIALSYQEIYGTLELLEEEEN